jgi:hypothetical protein
MPLIARFAVAVSCTKCASSAPVRSSPIISCSAGASGRVVGRLALRRCPGRINQAPPSEALAALPVLAVHERRTNDSSEYPSTGLSRVR